MWQPFGDGPSTHNGGPANHGATAKRRPGTPRGPARGVLIVLAAVALSVALLGAVVLVPQLHASYHSPVLHAALEAAGSLIAVLTAYLVFGRLRRRTRLNELMLTCGLAVLALLDLFLVTVPALVGLLPNNLTAWAALAGGVLGATLFALAAWVPHHPLRRPGVTITTGAAGVAAAALAAAALASAAAHPWPRSFPMAGLLPDAATGVVAHALQLVMAVLYGAATAGFWRLARRHSDEFYRWLAAAGVLATTARIGYFAHPVPIPQQVAVGDVFKFAAFLVLLLGSLREIRSYWLALSNATVLEARRRIAWDLHDGLAQELAYLARNLAALDGEVSEDTLARLRRAVDRAQHESRQAISALAATWPQSFEVTLADEATAIADRCGIRLDLDLAAGIRLAPARAEALVRIACEAVTNAARHSGCDQVALSLERDGAHVLMRIRDHGTGFDTSRRNGGFGLVSMRERARSVGGEFRIVSAPGRGSEVQVVV
jgi:signal transduction histidine kinase